MRYSKGGIIFIILCFFTSILFADTPEKYRIDAYYIGQEKITNAPEFAVERWTSRTYTTEYRTKGTIYRIEIDILKSGNNNPVEKIILDNGKTGGTRIIFDDVTFTGRDITNQKIIAYYSEYSDDGISGQVISIYEANNIGPAKEIITLVLIRE